MDVGEVKACLRALLSSSAVSYNVNSLLNDFRNTTGMDLPLFGCLHPIEFLRSLDDTVLLFGNNYNPNIALVKSQKSAHITSLVDRQRINTTKQKYALNKPKRLIVPEWNKITKKENQYLELKSAEDFTESKSETSMTCSSLLSNNNTAEFFEKTAPSCDLRLNYTTADCISNNSGSKSLNTNFIGKNSSFREKSPDFTKPVSPFSENVSENESIFSIDDDRYGSGQSISSFSCSVNNGIKSKLKKIIKKYPKGLWCCDLPGLFQKEYNFALDFREYGYTSLIQMLSELPDVFRCVRPGNEDWLVFDASDAPSLEEKEMLVLQATSDISLEVTAKIKKLLNSCFKNPSGIELDKLAELYKKTFNTSLDFQSMGFKDLKSLLKTWEGSFFSLLEIEGNTYVVPPLKVTNPSEVYWEEAVPPITEQDDIFVDIFPKDVVGPEESVLELDLTRHIAIGHIMRVTVAEVWSPDKFYVQFNKYRSRLARFMDDMQRFYNIHLNKYKMPDSTIRPQQVCAGLYTADSEVPDEWHRAQIVKVINEKVVLVNLIDFGTITRMRKSQLRFLHRSFQSFPVQGFLARLAGVAPPNGETKWSMSTSKKFLEYVRVPYLDAEMVDIDFKKPSFSVILVYPSQKTDPSINEKLVLDKLACEVEPEYSELFYTPEKGFGKQTKERNASGVSMQEKVNKNLPQETEAFSDITDLGQTTMFHFKMKCLKAEESENQRKESVKNLKYEFEEVPDLEMGKDSKEKETPKHTSKEFTVGDKPSRVEAETELEKPSSGLPPPAKLERLPPGLENVNVLPNFHEIQSLIQPEELKKKVNLLALRFLLSKPTVRQVGLTDPVLALKIATEMAEAAVAAESHDGFPLFTNPFPDGAPLNDLHLQGSQLPELPLRIDQKGGRTAETASNHHQNPSLPTALEKKENEYVKEIQIGGRIINLVTIDNQMYFCSDEIVHKFTLFSSREIAERILRIKKVIVDYKIISKKTHEKVLKEMKSPLLTEKKSKKEKIYLLPLTRILPFLKALGCHTKSFENEFLELRLTEGK